MFLGALLDLGLPIDGLRAALGSLAIEYGSVSAERVLRAGVSATKFRVHEAASAAVVAGSEQRGRGAVHAHAHHHPHGHGHDRHEIMATITRATAVMHRTTDRITA